MIFKAIEDINKHFNTGFTVCDIEYEGLRFSAPDNKKWISLFLIPEDANKEGESGLLKVICYDTSATLCFKLADEVKDFLDNAQFNGLSFDLGAGDGLGCLNLENGIYQTVVLFDMRTLNINCN